jgi:hypothetical protein
MMRSQAAEFPTSAPGIKVLASPWSMAIRAKSLALFGSLPAWNARTLRASRTGSATARWPVALTRAVWERCVAVPPGVACQDEAGRLWDVLWMLRCAAARQGRACVVSFTLHVRNNNRDGTPPLVRLKAVNGPGDDGEPVVTIMVTDED